MGLSSTTCGASTATIGVWPATVRVYMYYQQTCDLSYRVLSVITPTSRLYLGKPVRACLLWVMVNGFVQGDLSPHGCFDGGHGDKPSNWGAFCGPYFQTNITMMWLLEAILPLWQGIFKSVCSTPMYVPILAWLCLNIAMVPSTFLKLLVVYPIPQVITLLWMIPAKWHSIWHI